MKKFLSILLIFTALLVTSCGSLDKTINESNTHEDTQNTSQETVKETRSQSEDNETNISKETTEETITETEDNETNIPSETIEETITETEDNEDKTSKETIVETNDTETDISNDTIEDTTSEKEVKKEKPVIGIAWSKDFSGDNYPSFSKYYVESIEKAGGRFKFLTKVNNIEEAKKVLDTIDGVILRFYNK